MAGHAVAVEVAAVEVLGHVAELRPGCGHVERIAVLLLERLLVLRIGQQVAAVVHHLAVVVVGHHVLPAAVGKQAARRGQHVVDVPLREARVLVVPVVGDDVVARHQLAQPPGAGQQRVVLADAVGHVGIEVVEQVQRRDLDDLQRRAGGGFELLLQLRDRHGDQALAATAPSRSARRTGSGRACTAGTSLGGTRSPGLTTVTAELAELASHRPAPAATARRVSAAPLRQQAACDQHGSHRRARSAATIA